MARMPITTRLVFIDPIFVDIFVSLTIGVDTTKYDPNVVMDQIRYNILNYYDINSVTFGQDIRISNILALTNAIDGVSWAQVTRLHTTPPSLTQDTAPNPPLDIELEKWKLPSFVDMPLATNVANPSVSPPYVQGVTPISFNIGQNDIKVINPDQQVDILTGAYTYFPGSNLQHITISYTSTVDGPTPQGGYFGNPIPESDFTTYSSLE